LLLGHLSVARGITGFILALISLICRIKESVMLSLVGHSPNGIGIANSTILACLLDHFINANRLTKSEARDILMRATDELTPHQKNVAVKDALDIISRISVRFEQNV
jgi:hypothetical protein